MTRQHFDVPFDRLQTTDMRVPLSANPRYNYGEERRVVHVSHDPLAQLAYDQMPMRDKRRGAIDQERDITSPEIEQRLREHLDPDDFRGTLRDDRRQRTGRNTRRKD
jgi:hypothetical protein